MLSLLLLIQVESNAITQKQRQNSQRKKKKKNITNHMTKLKNSCSKKDEPFSYSCLFNFG